MELPDKLLDKRFANKRRAAGFLDSIPNDDPRRSQRTMSADQMRISMLAIDMDMKEMRGLFCLTKSVYHNYSSGRTPLPKGMADYLRLRVAQRIRAMSIATGTPVQLSEDVADNPSLTSLSAVESILKDLKIYLAT
tara:strand:- start:614 stop:1021 length:408 start_codon:yes stop_codon:yes gene_type:complete